MRAPIPNRSTHVRKALQKLSKKRKVALSVLFLHSSLQCPGYFMESGKLDNRARSEGTHFELNRRSATREVQRCDAKTLSCNGYLESASKEVLAMNWSIFAHSCPVAVAIPLRLNVDVGQPDDDSKPTASPATTSSSAEGGGTMSTTEGSGNGKGAGE